MNEEIPLEENRLKNFPIMMFATVMGLSGLTITYQKAALWLDFPHKIGEALMGVTTAIFILISMIYLVKYFKYKLSCLMLLDLGNPWLSIDDLIIFLNKFKPFSR